MTGHNLNKTPRIAIFISLCVAMILGAQIDVPMHPVPMTLQSLAILLAGLWLGPALGPLVVMVYLSLALAGLPVLSGEASGWRPFLGPTAGYLYAFILVAFLAGRLTLYASMRQPLIGIAALFGLHLILLGVGTAWLSSQMPLPRALSVGFTPFLIGALVKSALAWSLWAGPDHYRQWQLRRA